VLHESCELSGVVDAEERVKVIAHDDDAEYANTEEVLGATEDSEHEVVGGRARPKQESLAHGSCGHLDNGTRWDETQGTWHDLIVGMTLRLVAADHGEVWAKCLAPPSPPPSLAPLGA